MIPLIKGLMKAAATANLSAKCLRVCICFAHVSNVVSKSSCWLCCVQISDAESQYVRRSDCDTLFIVANYQPDKKDPSVAVNDEHALMRFEFLEAIVRLAVAK